MNDRIVLLTLLLCLSSGLLGFVLGVFVSGKWEITAGGPLVVESDYDMYQAALKTAANTVQQLAGQVSDLESRPPEVVVKEIPVSSPRLEYANPNATYTGEDLFQAVNRYRKEHGVPELQLHSELCQLSSHRLGEILDLGKLDNHAGFEAYFEDHKVSDMGLSKVAENLASGYDTAEEAVMGWDSSPPHRTFLLADGSFKYGCTSANLGFAVLIGGY